MDIAENMHAGKITTNAPDVVFGAISINAKNQAIDSAPETMPIGTKNFIAGFVVDAPSGEPFLMDLTDSLLNKIPATTTRPDIRPL
ncbi:MAG: hypothetical protein ACREPP_00775 [Rhodanobacteraceae bacterium]